MEICGLIMAGGMGTRLQPITFGVSKHLFPVYDKPMLHYAISNLLLAGVRDIQIIGCSRDIPLYKLVYGDGKPFGISISYVIQDVARGIADAFVLSENFIGTRNVVLALGDNMFFGNGLPNVLKNSAYQTQGATIFTALVKDPQRFGVLEVDLNNRPISIQEKPKSPKSNSAITGLYFFDNTVVDKAKSIGVSPRGELEITSVLDLYLQAGALNYKRLGRGIAWFDMGTPDALIEAASFVQAVQNRMGVKVACVEEICISNGWMQGSDLMKYLNDKPKNDYFDYVRNLASS